MGRPVLGQEAIASADAFASQPFAARVSLIAEAVNPLKGTVEVRLSIPAPPPFLRQDMTVSVEIEVARRSSALSIPTESVQALHGEHPSVLKIQGGRLRQTAVTLGIQDLSQVEIVSGLQAGDVIALHPAALKNGRHVRIQNIPDALHTLHTEKP